MTALVPTVAAELELAPVALPADQNPAAVYLARLAEGSRRTMRGALEVLARLLTGGRLGHLEMPWATLRYQHAQAARTALAGKYSPAGANKHLAALRGVLTAAWKLGQMTGEEHARAVDLEPVRGSRLPAGRMLADKEVAALFRACEKGTAVGARDAVLLALLAGGGLRRAELVALDLGDFDATTGALRVRGKGNKERVAYAKNGSRRALDAWLAHRGGAPGPLLCPVAKGGKLQLRRMTDQAVYDRLAFLGERAGVHDFSPHDMRRSFISNLLDRGADLATVQSLAGHANPATTARYDRRGERAREAAAELLSVPYCG